MEYPSPLHFAHGGAGILLSGVVVRDFAVNQRGIAQKWDERISRMRYGDAALARALHEDLQLDLTHVRGSMTFNEPQNTAFSEETWCHPILTMHHCMPHHFEELDQFERTRNASSVSTYRDLYAFFFPDGMPESRDNWHNMARDDDSIDWSITLHVKSRNEGAYHNGAPVPVELESPHESFEGCRLACIKNEQCFQFVFISSVTRSDLQTTHSCHHSRVFRLGRARSPEVDETSDDKEIAKSWSSGWLSDRIARWVDEHHQCHEREILWPSI